MSDADAVLQAAEARAAALAVGDAAALAATLHPGFVWSTHVGTRLDRDSYLARNTGGTVVWRGQRLQDAEVTVVGDTAVLTAVAHDTVAVDGRDETFAMPVTLTWVRDGGSWRCLAGHAGPRLP